MSRQSSRWEVVKELTAQPAAQVTIPHEIAWRIFTKGIDRDLARAQIKIQGAPHLANLILELTAIVT